MTTKPKGSSFNFADQGVFYSLLDLYPDSKSASAATNRTNIIIALGVISTNGGGVLLVPHGVSHNFVQADFPVTAQKLCLLTLQGNSFGILCNSSHTTVLGDLVKIAGQVVGKHSIVVALAAGSTQIADDVQALILNHAATIASHVINLPQNPQEGNTVEIYSRSAVTTLTLNAGSGETIATGHTLTTLTAGQSVKYLYDVATLSWYRVQ